MSKTNKLVFDGLHIVAWIIFVGLCIEAGALLVNFIFVLFKPDVVHRLYQKMDLSEMYAYSKVAFFSMYGLLLSISVLKAGLFYIVISLLLKLNLTQPFNPFVAKKILRISHYTLSIGLLSAIARQVAQNLSSEGVSTDGLNQFWGDWQAFILMAAIIYVIAIIFKKGVDLQTENDLTV
ncbi:MAG: DUF2975 domain-containing protein [Bacteroidetes bacterium]|nr:MAG: DUF2975 domain-containing protein [Bacteroidota bacterium]